LTDHGVQLVDVYVGPSGLLTGSARIAQDLREKAESAARKQQLQRKQLDLKQKRLQMEAQIERMRAEYEMEEQSAFRDLGDIEFAEKNASMAQEAMSRSRHADLTQAQSNGHA
jgi:circadian clock protein KaiC